MAIRINSLFLSLMPAVLHAFLTCPNKAYSPSGIEKLSWTNFILVGLVDLACLGGLLASFGERTSFFVGATFFDFFADLLGAWIRTVGLVAGRFLAAGVVEAEGAAFLMRDIFFGGAVCVTVMGTETRVRLLTAVVTTCFFVSNSVDVMKTPFSLRSFWNIA